MASNSEEVLRLVKQALNEFDLVQLDVSVRRAVRIANLLGESQVAIRLSFEVQPTGGHPPANAADARRLMGTPDEWAEPDGPVERALEEYFEDRKVSDGRIAGHSLAELEFWDRWREGLSSSELADEPYLKDLAWQVKRTQIIDRARSRTFSALCGWERQLAYAARNEQVIVGQQRRVDKFLASNAPQVLDQFNAVFRRLGDAEEVRRDQAAAEELAQAVTSCRRILKAVVDAVQPADPQRAVSEDGHELTQDAYKNRLYEFLKAEVTSETFVSALSTAAESLFQRFAASDKLASKGVHAVVAREEAEFCALNTYLLAGEVLRLWVGRVADDGKAAHGAAP